MRDLYNDEYIQIYLIYDKIPDIYDIEDIKSYMNNHSDLLYTEFYLFVPPTADNFIFFRMRAQ